MSARADEVDGQHIIFYTILAQTLRYSMLTAQGQGQQFLLSSQLTTKEYPRHGGRKTSKKRRSVYVHVSMHSHTHIQTVEMHQNPTPSTNTSMNTVMTRGRSPGYKIDERGGTSHLVEMRRKHETTNTCHSIAHK